MPGRSTISKMLPSPNYQDRLIVRIQTADDIATLLQFAEKDSRSYVNKLVPFFKAKTEKETCYKVWYWLRNNIQYVKEGSRRQTGKSLTRLIADGFGDCKHYATAAVCICHALNIPTYFRLVAQDHSNKIPNHVYAVAIVNGDEIYIDPCIKYFDNECKGYHFYNVSPLK